MSEVTNMTATEILETEGYLTMESLEGMDIEDIQNMIDMIESVIEKDAANLKVLKDARSKIGLELFDGPYKGKTSFETHGHIFVKKPKSEVSGKLLHDRDPILYKAYVNDHPELVGVSTRDLTKVMKERQMTTGDIDRVLGLVKVPLKPSVTAQKRTVNTE